MHRISFQQGVKIFFQDPIPVKRRVQHAYSEHSLPDQEFPVNSVDEFYGDDQHRDNNKEIVFWNGQMPQTVCGFNI